jgi:polar amino acid transport system substrate-binding protein
VSGTNLYQLETAPGEDPRRGRALGRAPLHRARPTVRRLGIVLPMLALVAAACSSTGVSPSAASSTGSGPGQVDPALHAMLPAAIQQSGVVKVASELDYPPVEYYDTDGKTPIGAEIELGQAMAKKLGVTFEFTNLAFDPTIPAITAGRFDTSMTYIGDKAAREQQVDFVDEFRSGYSIMVQKGNPSKISTLADLCGKGVSTQVGAANTAIVQDQDKRCTTEGKSGINMITTQNAADAILALKSGRVAAHLEDAPVAAYIAATSGGGNDFEVVGDQVTIRNHGMIFAKNNTQLRDAIQAALKAVIADGTYDTILKKYHVENITLKAAPINDPSTTNDPSVSPSPS